MFKTKKIGDPLEIEMFESTGWEIKEDESEGEGENQKESGKPLRVHPKITDARNH